MLVSQTLMLETITVHPSGHFLQTRSGKPFFYLADTAWELLHRCTREEITLYLDDRAGKGFTAIQTVLLAELDGLREPDPEGHLPLLNEDPDKPNEAYFEKVDWVVDQMLSRGLYPALLPTWGDKWDQGEFGAGPEIFTPENARTYGEWLARRYVDKPVIWVLGGDRKVTQGRHYRVILSMSEGLRTHGKKHLQTFHPSPPGYPREVFYTDPFFDFVMTQSGHVRKGMPNDAIVSTDYHRFPPIPCLDGEPCYEHMPVMNPFWDGDESTRWTAHEVRKRAWWAVFAGACGHAYGCHEVWQMMSPDRKAMIAPGVPWQEALGFPGSSQMQIVRRLIEALPPFSLIPDHTLLHDALGEIEDHQVACRDIEFRYILVYAPTNNVIALDSTSAPKEEFDVTWLNPADGRLRKGEPVKLSGKPHPFSPPSEAGPDYVLVLTKPLFSPAFWDACSELSSNDAR